MTSPRPVIGIVCYGTEKVPDRYSLPTSYVECVREAGGRAVLLPPVDDDPAGVLRSLDGLCLAGGGDVDPAVYGAEPASDDLYGVNPRRDELELALAREALARDLPFLAICRGSQIVNVARGGTLHQHLPDAVGEEVVHRTAPGQPAIHSVDLEPGSLPARVAGATELRVASLHHQGYDEPGEGVTPVAHAPDGVVEAFVVEGHPRFCGLQWHPEITADADPAQEAFFAWLVEEARAERGT